MYPINPCHSRLSSCNKIHSECPAAGFIRQRVSPLPATTGDRAILYSPGEFAHTGLGQAAPAFNTLLSQSALPRPASSRLCRTTRSISGLYFQRKCLKSCGRDNENPYCHSSCSRCSCYDTRTVHCSGCCSKNRRAAHEPSYQLAPAFRVSASKNALPIMPYQKSFCATHPTAAQSRQPFQIRGDTAHL